MTEANFHKVNSSTPKKLLFLHFPFARLFFWHRPAEADGRAHHNVNYNIMGATAY
jgi:hypothetical protein